MTRSRASRRLILALLPWLALQAQVPAQILKPLTDKLVQKLLTPKMKVDHFSLGGFQASEVDPEGDATAEKFSGTATFQLPPPLGPRKLTFKHLVLKGSAAEGTLETALPSGAEAEHQGWTYHLTRVRLSDKGSGVEGTATLAGMRLDVKPLTLTPQGLQGTLAPGDLLLATGPFRASLRSAEVTFGLQPPRLKGTLDVVIAKPVLDDLTGEEVRLEGGLLTLETAQVTGTAAVAPALATDLLLLHKDLTWRLAKLAFGFQRGTPVLAGPAQVRFPLNAFCRVAATDQPYLTDSLPCTIQGQVPPPQAPTPSGPQVASGPILRQTPTLASALATPNAAWEGFSGSFPLPAAGLFPAGLTTYRLEVEGGFLRVEQGVVDPYATRLSGRVSWGPAFAFSTGFKDAPAALTNGLYVVGSPMEAPAEVGAFRVYTPLAQPICDFSTTRSPQGLPPEWVGVHLDVFHLALPGEFYSSGVCPQRPPVLVAGKDGRFEGNGTFSGVVAVHFPDLINLHIAPVRLDPFELTFIEGALVQGPLVKGQMELTAPPLLEDFKAPIQFRLTQNGAEQIEISTQTPTGPMAFDTDLVGVQMVLDSARLNPTNLDFTGRFDFAIAGAALPSVDFDHLVLEASGCGIEGSTDPLSLDFRGSRWSTLPDQPKVSLWGYPFGLMESGYGVTGNKRFYVGLGGDTEIHPLLPTLYNRLLFTTEVGDATKGTVELEKLFDVDLSVASMGSLQSSLGFTVEAADDVVSDAYFMGTGALKVALGDAPIALDAGMRFGRRYQGNGYFPYFYALGHFESSLGGIAIAPDLELYGLSGGLAQNFLPDDIGNTQAITGTADPSLGLAVMAGVNVGTIDKFTFHGGLDLYVSQNLTTILQGQGWLFCGRSQQPPDNQVSADVRFTRNPNAFRATFDANLNFYQGVLRAMGRVELYFGPDGQFLHIGTREAPISARYLNGFDGNGYFTSDFVNGKAVFGAGGGISYSKSANFGPMYGSAWLNARGDLIIELDEQLNPFFLGTLAADGGASFGMKFKTYKTHKITIFSGGISTNMAFQVPGSPTLSGAVSIHYRVLGGLFKGTVTAHLDI